MRAACLILPFLPALAWAQSPVGTDPFDPGGLDLGPIETRNGRAPNLAFLRLDPRGGLLAPGERTLGMNLLIANNLRADGGTYEDQETSRLGFTARWGVARGEWAVEVPFLSREGGFLDPLIEAYHELIGIHNFRSEVPDGRVRETIQGSGTFGSAIGLGDVSGVYSRALGPQAFLSAAVKLPTGNAGGLLGSGNADFALSLYDRWRLARHLELYGQLGGVAQGHADRLDHNRTLVDQESLAFVYGPNHRDKYTFQWQSEPSALLVGDRVFDGPHRSLSVGYTRRLSAKDALQMYFTEDGDFLNFRVPELVNVAPDFTIGVGYTTKV